MGYVRLEEHNDWGRKYLSLPGEGVQGFFRTASFDLGLKFTDGQQLHVAWPDNSQSIETISHREESMLIGDHGRMYPETVRSSVPGVETVVRGVKHWTPLRDLLVLEEDLVKS